MHGVNKKMWVGALKLSKPHHGLRKQFYISLLTKLVNIKGDRMGIVLPPRAKCSQKIFG